MGLLDGIRVAERSMNVHRFRAEVALDNASNAFTPGYQRKVVDVEEGSFGANLDAARGGAGSDSGMGDDSAATSDALDGAVRIAGVRNDTSGLSGREAGLMAAGELLQAKNAFETSMRAATLLKSMALASLEIGRGA